MKKKVQPYFRMNGIKTLMPLTDKSHSVPISSVRPRYMKAIEKVAMGSLNYNEPYTGFGICNNREKTETCGLQHYK